MATMGTLTRDPEAANSRGRRWRALQHRAHRISGDVGRVAIVAVFAASPAAAQQRWEYTPSIGLEETLTNNVNLEPTDVRRGDLVTAITPSVSFAGATAHSTLTGRISVPILLY